MNSLKERFIVKSYESDSRGLFRLFSFMNHAQELAGAHAIKLGFGYDDLIESGNVWILSRFYAKFHRIPQWREELEMESWHKGNDKLFGYRDFLVTDREGIEIISATSCWLIIDSQTRRIQRIENILKNGMEEPLKRDAIKEPAARLITPPRLHLTQTKKVAISDLDMNSHTNNAKYVEWALDSLWSENFKKYRIKEMQINFNNESLLNEQIEIFTNQSQNGLSQTSSDAEPAFFVEGRRENCSIFQLQLNCSHS